MIEFLAFDNQLGEAYRIRPRIPSDKKTEKKQTSDD